MRHYASLLICTALAAAAFASQARAHHAFATEFDAALEGEVKGEVTRVWWQNPHIRYDVAMKMPDGTTQSLTLSPEHGGRSSGTLPISQMGLYRASDGTHTALAAAGPLNPIEFADVRTTPEKLAPLVQASGGGVFWAGDGGIPEVRRISPGRAASGHGWMGFRQNGDYVVTGFSELPLMPGFAALLLTVGLFIAAWRREGR